MSVIHRATPFIVIVRRDLRNPALRAAAAARVRSARMERRGTGVPRACDRDRRRRSLDGVLRGHREAAQRAPLQHQARRVRRGHPLRCSRPRSPRRRRATSSRGGSRSCARSRRASGSPRRCTSAGRPPHPSSSWSRSIRARAPHATAIAASSSTRSRTPRRRSRTSCSPRSTAGLRRAGSARSTRMPFATRSASQAPITPVAILPVGLLGRVGRPARAPSARRGHDLVCRRRTCAWPWAARASRSSATLIGDCHRCALGDTRTHARVRRGRPARPRHVHRRGAGQERGPEGRAVRGCGGQAARRAARARGPGARRGLHRQRAEVPSAGQPRSGARRDRDVHAVPARADPAHRRPRCSSRSATSRRKFVLQDRRRHHAPARHGRSRRGASRCCPIFHPAAAIYDRTKRDVLFDGLRAAARASGRRAERRAAASDSSGPEPTTVAPATRPT